jgi:hypothetical protein
VSLAGAQIRAHVENSGDEEVLRIDATNSGKGCAYGQLVLCADGVAALRRALDVIEGK